MRTRSWSGDSKNDCVRLFHRILAWIVSWQNSFWGSLLKLLMKCFKPLPKDQISPRRSGPGDESWIYSYDLKTKAQSSQCKSPGSPHLEKVLQGCSKTKTLLTVFFDQEGVVHQQSQAKKWIRGTSTVLRRMRDAMERKWLQLWASGDWQLHNGNMSAHASYLVQSFLVKN